MEAVSFYSTRGEHGCFSNFYRAAITLDGKARPKSEHGILHGIASTFRSGK
jgi:predicted NAD-dependent protein-ADP-ribosyltransferase YbiA (DUF1768 family)